MSHSKPPAQPKAYPWLPKSINSKEGAWVFLMDATHRGDMYHMRAAMALFQYPLCLYNCSPDTTDLVKYLERSAKASKQHVFLVPWSSDVLFGPTKPKLDNQCTLDDKPVHEQISQQKVKMYSENQATKDIAKQKSTGLKKISDNMVLLEHKSIEELDVKFATLFKTVWNGNKNTILGVYRKTGTEVKPGKPPGAYPELDTGDALGEIAKLLPDKGGKKLRIVSCGNSSKLAGIPDDIGEYWTGFNKVKLDPKDTKRDAEAYFLQWAFKKEYYQMATGFRSGALDLFTFLGIPTVSIGLRNLMGEGRHKRLASDAFKRINIQYDQPRHDATAYFKLEEGDLKLPQMASPFWLQEPPPAAKRPLPHDKSAEIKKLPVDFTLFDKVVVKVGYGIACPRFIGATESIKLLNKRPDDFNVIKTEVARYGYPSTMDGDQQEANRKAYFQTRRKEDEQDLAKMSGDLIHYQESITVFEGMYGYQSKTDWKEIYASLDLDEVS